MMLRCLLSCCFLLLLAGPAQAQQPASTTVEGALQGYFSEQPDDPAAAVLVESGFAYERMLVAERLPSGVSLFVEVELVRDDLRFRYPLKLEGKSEGDESSWRVQWAPEEEYARGLVAMGDVQMLAAIEADQSWASLERLPALPVLVAEQALVTPFGHVAEPPSERSEPGDDLVPPKELVKHAQNWVGLVLEDEPGAANVDLIVARGVSWRRVTQAVMATAALGMFRLYVVGAAEESLVAVSTVAPVLGADTAQGSAPVIVGMYPAGEHSGFRVRVGDRLLEGEGSCAEGMTLCAATAASFGGAVGAHITRALDEQPVRVAYVMFGATGDFSVEEVVGHLRALGDAVGVAPDKMLVSFIADEQAEPTEQTK